MLTKTVLVQPINDLARKVTLLLAVLNGILGFLGGIVMLGTWYFPMLPFFPTELLIGHPFLVLFGFFTTFIILERWVGLQVMENRPQSLLDLMLIMTIIGAFLILMFHVYQIFTGKELEIMLVGGLSCYLLSAFFMLLLQVWVFRSVPQFKTEAGFLMMGFGVFMFITASLIISQVLEDFSFTRQLTYLPSYLVLGILGERITFARMGRFGKEGRFGKRDRYHVLLGMSFVFGVIIDIFTDNMGVRFINFLILGSLTILIFLDDTGTKSSITETSFHVFQRWALLGGYAWLLVGIILMEWNAFNASLFLYDSALHAITLGFIITMLLAHAPIVLPTVLGKPATTELPGALTLVIIFWIFILLRIIGNVLQLFFPRLPFLAMVALTGYFSIIPIGAYLLSLILQMKAKRTRHVIAIQ